MLIYDLSNGTNNFQKFPTSYNGFRSYTAKVDHNISEKHRIFVRYNQAYQIFTSEAGPRQYREWPGSISLEQRRRLR